MSTEMRKLMEAVSNPYLERKIKASAYINLHLIHSGIITVYEYNKGLTYHLEEMSDFEITLNLNPLDYWDSQNWPNEWKSDELYISFFITNINYIDVPPNRSSWDSPDDYYGYDELEYNIEWYVIGNEDEALVKLFTGAPNVYDEAELETHIKEDYLQLG